MPKSLPQQNALPCPHNGIPTCGPASDCPHLEYGPDEEKHMQTGVDLIAAERERQLSEENWAPDHDDEHTDGSIAKAAATYAMPAEDRPAPARGIPNQPASWPWEEGSFKPTPDDRVRELAKAGALIAAEIDRIQRLA